MQQIFRALADPTRREILLLLRKGALSAGDIADKFAVTGATISHHLALLKEADLVEDQRQGKFIIYRLNTSVVEDLLIWFQELRSD